MCGRLNTRWRQNLYTTMSRENEQADVMWVCLPYTTCAGEGGVKPWTLLRAAGNPLPSPQRFNAAENFLYRGSHSDRMAPEVVHYTGNRMPFGTEPKEPWLKSRAFPKRENPSKLLDILAHLQLIKQHTVTFTGLKLCNKRMYCRNPTTTSIVKQ